MVARPGIEPGTPDLRVRCPTDCATRPGQYFVHILSPVTDNCGRRNESMWPDQISNPGPLNYESGARLTALHGPAIRNCILGKLLPSSYEENKLSI